MEVIHPCCAGMDLHKADVKVCLVWRDAHGQRQQEIRTYATTTGALLELSDWLAQAHCPIVAMESTGVYWKSIYILLVWQGHLRQHRFFSEPLDETYRWRALRYVELNPVRAGLVARPEDYPWSSAAVHLGVRAATSWLDVTEWHACWTPASWRDYLRAHDEAEHDLAVIRDQTYLGRPLGSTAFIQQVEQQTGRRLQFGAVGRPKTPRKDENRGHE